MLAVVPTAIPEPVPVACPDAGRTVVDTIGTEPLAATAALGGPVAAAVPATRPARDTRPTGGVTTTFKLTVGAAPAPDTIPVAGATVELTPGANPVVRWLPAVGDAANAAATSVDPAMAAAPMAADERPKAIIRYEA